MDYDDSCNWRSVDLKLPDNEQVRHGKRFTTLSGNSYCNLVIYLSTGVVVTKVNMVLVVCNANGSGSVP